jgi:hypothetical protein
VALRNLGCVSLQVVHATGCTVVRHALTLDHGYPQAKRRLRRSWLTSPVYFIIAGERAHEGACFARSRYGVDGHYALSTVAGAAYPSEGQSNKTKQSKAKRQQQQQEEEGEKGEEEEQRQEFVAQCNSDWWRSENVAGDTEPVAQLVDGSTAKARRRGLAMLARAARGGTRERCAVVDGGGGVRVAAAAAAAAVVVAVVLLLPLCG